MTNNKSVREKLTKMYWDKDNQWIRKFMTGEEFVDLFYWHLHEKTLENENKN